MGFSEKVKLKAKKRSDFACVVCGELFVDVHHIIPQKDGGPHKMVVPISWITQPPSAPSATDVTGAILIFGRSYGTSAITGGRSAPTGERIPSPWGSSRR